MADIPKLTALVGVAAVVGVGGILALPGGTTDEPGGVDISSGDHRLDIVAYAVPKPGFDVIIPGYRETAEGADTGFAQSYGASGDQSRKVARRVPADLVNFSVEPDITRLVKEGIVDEDWKDNVPGDESGASVPFGSVVSFVTREGNPKGLETWDDLLQPGIQVISPNPASSGSAKWNLLAPYSAWFYSALEEQGDAKNYTAAHEEALNKVSLLVGEHFNVRPKSGREATSTFEQGQGDVLLSYENEAILLDRSGSAIDYLNPPQTFRIENPVAVVNTTEDPEQAESFRDYLFTEDAEKLWASEGFRPGSDLFTADGSTPVIDSLPAEERDAFSGYEDLYSIDDLSQAFSALAQQNPQLAQKYGLLDDNGDPKTGWSIVDALLFARSDPGSGDPNGAITEIYQQV